MNTLPLSTRSLAAASLFISAVALVFSLTRPRELPHAQVHTTLAASPKTALTHTVTHRDPSTARSYYLQQFPEVDKSQ